MYNILYSGVEYHNLSANWINRMKHSEVVYYSIRNKKIGRCQKVSPPEMAFLGKKRANQPKFHI